MKEIILLMLTVVMSTSCKPRIDNSPETLEKVFAMPDFDIEIRSSGCFGGSEYHFVVKLEDDGYLLKSKRTGKSRLVSKVRIDSLKTYLGTKIGKVDNGGCTVSHYIRVGSFFNAVDYRHNHCSGIEATRLNDLLSYYELIYESETEE